MAKDNAEKDKKINRRDFLALASAGLAGAIIAPGLADAGMMGGGGSMGGGGGGMGGGGGGGGTTVIDPPVGPAFSNPPEAAMTRTGNVVELELDAREAVVNVNGTSVRLMTYNGTFPGPTIRARKNDILRIHHTNSLPPTTQTNLLGHTRNVLNLHTHGLHVSPMPPADYMGIMLSPGEDYHYEYDLLYEEPGHLNLYHPHVHGVVAEGYWAGLMGALVIEDESDTLAAYDTRIMVLKDITVIGGLPEPHASMMDYMHGKEGATVVMNGAVNPLLTMRPGQVQRWQIVNGCNARFFMLSLEGHEMYLIGTDSGLTDVPYRISSVLLSPGERVDLLVKASRTKGRYRFLSLPYNRGGMSRLQQVTLMTVDVKGPSVNGSLPLQVNPLAKRISMDTTALTKRTMALSMMQGLGYINGITFKDMENCYSFMSELGTYEVWEIINDSGMDHPFHQHVNACQVQSITGGDAGYSALLTGLPVMKDTVVVPKWGSVTMLVPITHWPGMSMFHCHIIEHEDIGMMGMWHIMDGGMPM